MEYLVFFRRHGILRAVKRKVCRAKGNSLYKPLNAYRMVKVEMENDFQIVSLSHSDVVSPSSVLDFGNLWG